MDIQQYLQNRQQRINLVLQNILPNINQNPIHLHEAMHYAVLNGGKRIRPLLVYATGEAFGVDLAVLDLPACAIELIHAYSLVHDDLPAMDNDDLRRGKPTCHRAFDEATAILVGDALQSLAFEILSQRQDLFDSESIVEMVSCLAKASGSFGMAGGQSLDLKATGQTLPITQLQEIHALKTGALISACVRLGLISGKIKDPAIVEAFTAFAYYIGLCFQIKDDILDVEGSALVLGKEVGGDQANQKMTYVTLRGLDEAKTNLHQYFEEAMTALAPYHKKATRLAELASLIIKRDH